MLHDGHALRNRPLFWGSVLKSVYLAWPMRFQILKRRSARRTLWRAGCGLQTIPEHCGHLARSCGSPDRKQIQDQKVDDITREWDAFIQRATGFDIEHFVLFACFLFDDADLDPVEHATRLACRSLLISDTIDGDVIIGFATRQGMEDFIAWGNEVLCTHRLESPNGTDPASGERY